MTQIHVCVARLLHRPQHEERDGLLFGLALDPLDQLLEVTRTDRTRRRGERIAEPFDELLELTDFHVIGLFVNAVEAWRLLSGDELGHRLVREEHEFLDDPVGHVALGDRDVLDEPLIVHDHLGLGEIEIDRAAAPAPDVQDAEEVVHQLEHRQERLGTRRSSSGRDRSGSRSRPCTSSAPRC